MGKFNSQICTSREQSERLLALGLKKETADMHWAYHSVTATRYVVAHPCDGVGECIPAWSLHRLIEMMPKRIYYKNLFCCFLYIDSSVYVEYRHSLSQTIMEQFMKSNLWDNLIDCIEWLIKEGYFNKEYLEE